MTYKGFSPTDFERTANTTLANHLREEEKAFMRNFQFLAMLEGTGNILYNQGGRGLDWPVRYRIHQIEGNTGETQRNFARRNLWKTANLEYRGYQVTDSMYMREFKENRGPHAIVDVFNGFTRRLDESIRQALGTEFYIDGEAAANATTWHGVETMFQNNGTLNISTGAQRSANAADLVGYADGEYAGIDMELGFYGGENESGEIWPNGVADPEYDFWTPLEVNYTSTALGGATDTWPAQGDEAMRYAIINAQRNTTMDGQVTNIWLARDLYRQLLNLLDDKEEVQVSTSGEMGLRAFGFKNVLIFDGLEVSWETGISSGVGYGLNMNQVELRSMDEQLFVAEGPEYDLHSQSFNAVVSTLSNLKFNSPRNCFKLSALA